MTFRNIHIYILITCLGIFASNAQNDILEKQVLFTNGSIELPGTLVYHDQPSQPLIVFVHGSGNIDRNGNQQGIKSNANYIKQLSDSLTQRGLAFFRYDKRTSNVKNIAKIMNELSFKAFSEDVKIVVDSLKKDKRFSSIHLVGHSQGSLVAMMAIDEDIDSYISIAGVASSIDKTIVEQVRKQNGDSLSNIVVSHFKELRETDSIANVNPLLMSLFNKPTQPFLKEWMSYEPAEEIKNIDIPMLIINGDKDIQVAVEDAEALHKANPKSELVILKNMNHVLKTIENDGDNMSSYATPDFPLSIELVEVIADFIKK